MNTCVFKLNKTLAAVFACLVAFSSVCYAQDENLSEAGKDILNGVNEFLQRTGDSLDKKIRSYTPQACIGIWVFNNGKCSTRLTCTDGGRFVLQMNGRFSSESYYGTYESTSSQITVHVTGKEGDGLFFKTKDLLDEVWIIKYRVTDDKEMRLESDSLPDDDNGYDFSYPAIFVKQGEDVQLDSAAPGSPISLR